MNLVDEIVDVAEIDVVNVRYVHLEAGHMGDIVLGVLELVRLVVVQQVAVSAHLVGNGLDESYVEVLGNRRQGRSRDNRRTELHHAMYVRLLRNLQTLIVYARVPIMHNVAPR